MFIFINIIYAYVYIYICLQKRIAATQDKKSRGPMHVGLLDISRKYDLAKSYEI